MKDIPTFGCKLAVFHGKAHKTKSGLTRKDFMRNRWGRVVSVRKHRLGKKNLSKNHPFSRYAGNLANLKRHQGGHAKFTRSQVKKKRSKLVHLGGMGSEGPLSPEEIA